MNKYRLVALVALAAVLVLSIGAEAQNRQAPGKGPGVKRGWMGRGCDNMGPRMRMGRGPRVRGRVNFYLAQGERLELSKEQIDRLRDLKFAFEKAGVKRRAELQTAMIEMQQLRSAESVDAKKMESRIREVFSKRAELAVAAFKAQTEADKVLTDGQRAKAKTPWKGEWMRRPGRGNRPAGQPGNPNKSGNPNQ